MKLHAAILAVSVLLLSGCASVVSKSEYAVAINSTPDQAEFVVSNKAGEQIHQGITPSSITLKASSGYFKGEVYTISLSKEGYVSSSFELRSTVDGWYWGNILLGGLIGMLIVDPATGAMYSLPATSTVTLEENGTEARQPASLTIATLDSLNLSQMEALETVNDQ